MKTNTSNTNIENVCNENLAFKCQLWSINVSKYVRNEEHKYFQTKACNE